MQNFIKTHKYVIAVFLMSLCIIAIQAILFRDRLSIENYPFVHQDFWRRITDALYFIGKSETVFIHPPIPSLLYSLSFALGDSVLFILNAFHFLLGSVFTYLITLLLTKNQKISFITALFFISSATILKQFSYYGLVDGWCASWILVGVYFFISWQKTNDLKLLFITSLITVFAALIQYAGFFVLPCYVLFIWFQNKKILRKTVELSTLLIPITLIFSMWQLFLYFQFGHFFFSKVDHFIYLLPSINNIGRYFFDTVVFATLPFITLSFFGLRYLKKDIIKVLLFFAPYFIFFGFLYSWYDHRFIIYWIFPIFLSAAVGITKVLDSKRIPKYFSYLIFILLLLFNNIYSPGFLGMPLPQNLLLHSSKEGLVIEKREEPFFLWSFYFLEINNRYSHNPELNYFRETSGIRAKTTVKESDEICIKTDKNDFVLEHQLIYYAELFDKKLCQ